MQIGHKWRHIVNKYLDETCVPACAPAFDYVTFAQRLAQWFAGAQRDLLWRRPENARDPYRILVSEIMLQQTTVAAVGPFYERFLQRFPTLQNLAEASMEEVLPLWAGLGYYQRARLLHAAARAVTERHGGEFPRELDAVLALPGIGRYTAGAVTSIAFDLPAPIVDANVARVFSRLFLLEGDLKSALNQKLLWAHAERVVESCESCAAGDSSNASDKKAVAACRPSIVNPALMELGALICVPRAPRCEACPVAEFCAARSAGRQHELPHIAPRRAPVALHDDCVFIRRKKIGATDATSINESRADDSAQHDQILLRQRPHEARTWWRGMWELPRVTRRENESGPDALRRLLRGELHLPPDAVRIGPRLKTVRHGVTHHHITLDCWSVEVGRDVERGPTPQNARWFGWDEMPALAMPSSIRRLLLWLRAHPLAEQPSLW